jgi:phage-related protein
MAQVGSAFIQVVPSLRGWGQQVRQQLTRELAGVKAEVPIEGDFDGLKREASRKGQEAGGEFAQSFRRRVEAALKALPDVDIGADATPAQREIAEIRRELQTLSEKTVGIDLDAGQATAQIQRLKARLDQLGADSTSIDLDVDIGAASAQLGAIERQVSRLDGRRASVSVDVDRDGNAQRASFFLTQQVNGLVLAGAGIAPVFVPAFAAAAAGALGFAASIAGAGAGVGALVAVAVPAFSAVSEAVKATEQQEKAAATSAVNTTRQRVQAAFQAQQAAQRVADAQRSADRTAVEGARRVQDAQRALADVRRDVADRIDDANRKVGDSERALQRAHDNVRHAQEDLTRAREDAIRTLQDLREQTSDLVLSEEGAEIALIEARQRLAEVNRDTSATLLDRRKAVLEVREAEDRLSDVHRDQRRSREELNDAERAGIAGSEQVLAANDRLSDASAGLADARRTVADAQRDLAQAEVDGARAIANAEREVSDARTTAAQANADAVRAVGDALQAQAQQAELARLEAENGIAANRNLAFALGELTGMQRALYDGWLRLRDAFTEWARALEPAVLPLFIRGMQLIEDLLPLLTPLVLATAGAFDYLLDRASAALDSPFWRSFIDFLTAQAPGAIIAFGESVGNIARGLAGILMAFGIFSGDLNRGLVDLTERFADWGEGLADNPGFHRFVDFVRTVWPPLKDTIGSIADAFVAIVEALAPLGGGPVLSILRGIADWVAGMDPTTIQAIAFALGGIALAIKLIGIAMAIASIGPWGLAILAIGAAVAFAYFKFEGFREIIQAFVGWVQEEVVPRLRAFGEAVARLFEEEIRPRLEAFWAWFQAEIVPVLQDIGDEILKLVRRAGEWLERNWPDIQNAIEGFIGFLKWAWDTVIFPILDAFWKNLSEKVGPALLDLWHNILEPAWKAISAIIAAAWIVIEPILKALAWVIEHVVVPVITWLYENVGIYFPLIWTLISFAWNYVIKPIFDAIAWVIRNVVAPVIAWLWNEIIVPAWNGISAAISWAWQNVIKPVFDAIWWVLTNVVGPIFRWLWREVIKPVWERISDAIGAAWRFIRDRVFEPIRNFLRDKLVPAFRTARDTIVRIWQRLREIFSDIWDRISDITRGAVNTVIRIINKIGDAIERVAGAIGLDITIRDIPTLRDPNAARRPTNTAPRSFGMAAGGVVPAVDLAQAGPFVTAAPRAIVGEGSRVHPEFVIPTDPKFRGRALDLFGQLGTQLMASGGIARSRGPGIAGLYAPLATKVSQLIERANGAVNVVSGWRSRAQQQRLYDAYREGGNKAARPGNSQHEAGNAVDLGGNQSLYMRLARQLGLVAPVSGEPWHWEHPNQGREGGGGIIGADFVQWIVDAASGIGDLGKKLFGLPKKALTWLKDKAIGWVKEQTVDRVLGSAGGIGRAYLAAGSGGGVERWRATALKALRMTHSPASWIGSLLRRMNQESGGNPNAINLTDINAQRGDPSGGLMQNIRSAYRSRVAGFPSLRGTSFLHPLGSIVASIVYANQRYGSAPRGWDKPGGYAMGGILPFLGSYQQGTDRVPHDGLAFLHRDEAVLDAGDAAMFRAAAMGSVKGGRTFEQTNQFFGLTDYDEIARTTGEELAWQATVGSH